MEKKTMRWKKKSVNIQAILWKFHSLKWNLTSVKFTHQSQFFLFTMGSKTPCFPISGWFPNILSDKFFAETCELRFVLSMAENNQSKGANS